MLDPILQATKVHATFVEKENGKTTTIHRVVNIVIQVNTMLKLEEHLQRLAKMIAMLDPILPPGKVHV